MSKTAFYTVTDQNLSASLGSFFKSMLGQGDIRALMVPMILPSKTMVMQTLVTDPDQLEHADPFAPSFPMNSARLVSRLTKKSAIGPVAVVLRPCEIRAHIELVKLKQASGSDLVIVGIDCPGAFGNTDYKAYAAAETGQTTGQFIAGVLSGKTAFEGGAEISTACRACTHMLPDGADIGIGIFGVDTKDRFMVTAQTEKGDKLLEKLGLTSGEVPAEREQVVESLLSSRESYKKDLFETIREKTAGPAELSEYLSGCINCYNCRVACPVCYCRECVFVTDVFDHDPYQYLRWANRKGKIKLPTDTVFYHLTRMAHMSTACVGCGQCSNACPNDIPLAQLFAATAEVTQKAFEYEAGRSPDEEPPLSVFKEDEFAEVTGGKH